jgi:hypothetical protein
MKKLLLLLLVAFTLSIFIPEVSAVSTSANETAVVKKDNAKHKKKKYKKKHKKHAKHQK